MLHSQIILTMTWYSTLPLKSFQDKNTLSKTSNIQNIPTSLMLMLSATAYNSSKPRNGITLPNFKFQIYPNTKLKRLVFYLFSFGAHLFCQKKLSHTNPIKNPKTFNPDIRPLLRLSLLRRPSSRGAKWALRL